MLLGVIAIVAATGLEVVTHWSLIQTGGMDIVPLFVGAITALLVGIPALKWLIIASRRARFRPFALYCYVLAILALFLHFMCHH